MATQDWTCGLYTVCGNYLFCETIMNNGTNFKQTEKKAAVSIISVCQATYFQNFFFFFN